MIVEIQIDHKGFYWVVIIKGDMLIKIKAASQGAAWDLQRVLQGKESDIKMDKYEYMVTIREADDNGKGAYVWWVTHDGSSIVEGESVSWNRAIVAVSAYLLDLVDKEPQ